MQINNYLGLALLGAGVGYASGLFGVGGGFMLTPLLVNIFGVPVPVAVGSGLAQMIFVGMAAALKHRSAGYMDFRMVVLVSPGLILGTFIGAGCLHWLDALGRVRMLGSSVPVVNLTINAIFVVMLIWIALKTWRESGAGEYGIAGGCWSWSSGPCLVALPASGITRCSLVSLTSCGLMVGVMAGLLGIGGGVILIPVLLYGFGQPMRVAIGTSALIICVSSTVGATLHAAHGHVHLRLAGVLLAGSLTGAHIGAWHSLRTPVKRLRKAFSILVAAVAVIVIARFLK